MTYEMILAKAQELGDTLEVMTFEKEICIDVNDFGGFDEDWNEIEIDYDEEKVEEFEEFLKENALQVETNLYTTYSFDGFVVRFGYASFDI